ncbi:MAG: helix-turn-helix transcriptional regulator [Chloroflexota bacterium]|nr:helix-turn-helix transcriptional regulator [Chloroflexota bacterium]
MGDQTAGALKAAFGQRIREVRQDRGLSQEALASLCDLDRTYIGSVERGERNISLVNISKLAAALGVSPKVFFD